MATYFFARWRNKGYNELEKGIAMLILTVVLIIVVIVLAYVLVRVLRQKRHLRNEVYDLKSQLYLNQLAVQLVTHASWEYYIASKPRYYPNTCHVITSNRMVSNLTGCWPDLFEFHN